MQRGLGQLTGTCFQRCVGMDAINPLFSVTYDMDQAAGTFYHRASASLSEMNHVNSHWILVMPTMRLRPVDRDYAVCAAIPVDHPSLTFIYGRQSCDTRALEGGEGK
jgi:4-hydroxybutyryl-CoA dehydratase / vinylacetyl-CoA-Delta-isomerase